MIVLIDSDILIEVARGRDAAILEKWAELAEADDVVLCSPVSVAELWHGARPKEHNALENLFHALACVPVDAETGRQAGEYLRVFHKSHAVELGDALIAAAAVRNRATLWTRNRKHYPMKGLRFY
ncbi:MAG: type II toxin-antitoxin system VapC family toxin [Acidobacteriota bacterium]|nr:type II toxin-antitoxin system VapC family toxin [Acidobacteriota bacterium]